VSQPKKHITTLKDLKAVFGSDQGKRVLYGLMLEAGLLAPSSSLDAQNLAFEAGKRHIVLSLVNNLKLDVAALERAIEETSYQEMTG
jgi:hypothetical protein